MHVSDEAFSKELKKHHPLDATFAVVEHVIRMVKPKLPALATGAKIENKMDLKRVFTLPLSLHRELDYSGVCFKPEI